MTDDSLRAILHEVLSTYFRPHPRADPPPNADLVSRFVSALPHGTTGTATDLAALARAYLPIPHDWTAQIFGLRLRRLVGRRLGSRVLNRRLNPRSVAVYTIATIDGAPAVTPSPDAVSAALATLRDSLSRPPDTACPHCGAVAPEDTDGR